MMQAFVENLIEAFRTPRTSARRMIALAPNLRDCLLMVVLAFAIQGLLSGLLSGPSAGGIAARFAELGLQLALFFLIVIGAHRIGARFGGKATPEQIGPVVAWHYLVTSFLAPLNVLGMRAVNPETGSAGILFLLVPFSVGLSIWLLASFLAEAHGFQRLGPVIMATVAGFLGLGLITMIFLGIVSGAAR